MNEQEKEELQKAIEKTVDEDTAALPLLHQVELLPEESTSPQDVTRVPPRRWFFTFMCMNIPIVGWVYLIYLARNCTDTNRRDFARAYLFYKLLFLIISLLILGVLVYIGLGLLDQLLAYMEML